MQQDHTRHHSCCASYILADSGTDVHLQRRNGLKQILDLQLFLFVTIQLSLTGSTGTGLISRRAHEEHLQLDTEAKTVKFTWEHVLSINPVWNVRWFQKPAKTIISNHYKQENRNLGFKLGLHHFPFPLSSSSVSFYDVFYWFLRGGPGFLSHFHSD